MSEIVERAIAIVGVGAVLPDAPDVKTFWDNIVTKRYSISEVDAGRWNPDFYFDPDRQAINKSYSKIGGWVREWAWEPLEWRLPIPPKVSEAMDRTQQWAIVAARQALADYGYPNRPLDQARTAVIVGNAMGGDLHYLTAMSVYFPEYADELAQAPAFAALAPDVRQTIIEEMQSGVRGRFPGITEDTMPGELANIIAGRVANLFDFHGPNFVVDAACASAMAAIDAAVEGLETGDYDAVLTGGVDANMSASTFVKFCKIGALSATGTRPFGDGADGFVMGEGAALFLLKRLADAERDGDHVYAVIRGIGGASDGKGKGITAPNPVGQRLAIQRAWRNADLVPGTATLIEAHGTSTKVGDVVESQSFADAFADLGLAPGSLAVGSVKSNIGHLKGAAGAAGMLKAALALDHKVLPPSLGADTPNPNIDFEHSPLAVNTERRDWDANGHVRSAGISAFGFGGTNFHMVLEEHVPGRLSVGRAPAATVAGAVPAPRAAATPDAAALKAPLRGAVVVGGVDNAAVSARLAEIQADAEAGTVPELAPPAESDLRSPVRVAIDFGDADELAGKVAKARKALEADNMAAWRLLANQGIFHGTGPAHQVAMLYTGQGSQYVNMLADLRDAEPIVQAAFDEADRIMEPLIGQPLSDIIFVDPDDEAAVAEATERLRQTEITQPAVLTADLALTRLLDAYGIQPDMVMGHSLGEYGALVASGALRFADALEAVSARGREMANVSVDDNGLMAAVFAPIEEVEAILATIEPYVVIANINSRHQAVVGGSTEGVEAASAALTAAGHQVVPLPVSHAFHTEIVAPAAEPLRQVLARLDIHPPTIPTVANVNGEFYPMGPAVAPDIVEILGRQVASPVQFIAGLHTLHEAGARVFVEVGPKRALHGFVEDVLGDDDEVMALYSNHPKSGGIVSFNQALCGLYASGLGVGTRDRSADSGPVAAVPAAPLASAAPAAAVGSDRYVELGHLFADVLERGYEVLTGNRPAPAATSRDARGTAEPVVITGAALGLPGTESVFDDANISRLLDGESFIDVIPVAMRERIVDKHITRLVKSEAGGGRFEAIDSAHDVIKLAGRKGRFDIVAEFGLSEDRKAALDPATELAIGAGIDALRDAGLPLAMRYKTTSTGSRLPEAWALPVSERDDTAVIFASAFPGTDRLVDEVTRYEQDRGRHDQLAALEHLRSRMAPDNLLAGELDHMIHELSAAIESGSYEFDRRFLFKALSMGHAQFAEFIGARGPNTQINSACASTTQAVAIAEDWIRLGRAKRVIIIAGDDVTSDTLMDWVGAGFLSTGAAATDEVVEEAALPFDRRRHGMILGMGAAAIVVERADAARERGIRPICEVLSTTTANSAFHGSRLDVTHIRDVMEDVVARAEQRWGIDRHQIAPATVFVSHETYTPARGGSAQAEVDALRHVFGSSADSIVIANTKGFTGHAMGVGIEDVLAIKALETGIVPPIANVKETDPELGRLNLSKGGAYPVSYALRLGAGFGSQISLSLLRWVPSPDGSRREPDELGFEYRVTDPAAWQRWLSQMSGYETTTLETVHRTLRVRDDGPPSGIAPAPERSVEQAPAVISSPPLSEPVAAAAAPPPAAPAVAESVVAAPAAAPAEAATDPVVEMVLAVVAEQTGYPSDMLELELDLEADLGIDTVKQAETFAAIREHYGIERDDNLSLRDYPTLAHVVGFVRERANLPATPAPAPAVSVEAEAPAAAPAEAATTTAADLALPQGDDAASAALKRRIPVPVLRPDLDLCVETGVVLDTGAPVVVMADAGGVGTALAKRLEARGVDVLCVEDTPLADDLLERVRDWLGDRSLRGVYWLPALDVERHIDDQDLDDWREGLRRRVKLLFRLLRDHYDGFGAGTFLVTGTRLGGEHGYGPDVTTAPMGGAVVGLAKAFKRERPDVLVKAVDFPMSRKTASLADFLIDETLRDPGAIEIGRLDGRRWTIALVERPLPDDHEGVTLDSNSVFVVTGAAGSIVSAIIGDLARASGGTFHLLDLAPAPDPSDADVAAFADHREELKRTLFERLKEAGERATPATVERQLGQIERRHAALGALRAIEASGGTAHYHQVDLRDADAMAAEMARIADLSGSIDVLIHAGGLEISRAMPDKDPDEYDLVFDVKADGWFNLLKGLGRVPLDSAVVFSSIAGRFGNAGQTDYSAANDLLCKQASSLDPDTLALAIDWTAWGDIGMATRGSIPQVMEAAGIDMLPAVAGIPFVRRELTGGGLSREIVVAERLGVMADELHPTGGLAIDADAAIARRVADAGGVTATEVRGMTSDGLVVAATLDPTTQPFLDHHRIDGTAVLPGVMGVESMARAASLLFPDHRVIAVEDVDFLAAFKFFRDEPREIIVTAQFETHAHEIVAHCTLLGERVLANQSKPQRTVHFTSTVRLGADPVDLGSADPASPDEPTVGADDIYRIYFHGPAYRVMAEAWSDGERMYGRAASGLPAGTDPADAPLVTSPRSLELCFQTAGVWEIGSTSAMALPMHLDRVVVGAGGPESLDGLVAIVTPHDDDSASAIVVDGKGRVRLELTGYRTVQLPGNIADDLVAPLRAASIDRRTAGS